MSDQPELEQARTAARERIELACEKNRAGDITAEDMLAEAWRAINAFEAAVQAIQAKTTLAPRED